MASNKKLVSLKNLKHFLDYLRTKFTAPMAKCDEDGNIIADTYLPAKNVMKDGERDFTGKIPKVDAHDALQISTDMTFNKEISGKNKQATLKFDGARLVSDVPIQAQLVGTMDTTVKEALKADSVEWRDVLHAPDMNNYALKDEGLQVHNLGVDKTKPYTMNYKDFNKVGIYHIYYGDANAMPKGCADNLWIFKLDNGIESSTLLAAASGTDDSYIGHFVNKVWKGWRVTSGHSDDIDIGGSWNIQKDAANRFLIGAHGMNKDYSKSSYWIDQNAVNHTLKQLRVDGGLINTVPGTFRLVDTRITDVGTYAPTGQVWYNQLFFMGKNEDHYYGYIQGIVTPTWYGTEIGTSNTTAHNNNVFFRTEVNNAGKRYTKTNSTFIPEGIMIPTSDNGQGNFWIS